jgi:hypothetical protein
MHPTIYATALFDKLDEFMLEFKEHDQEISAGVASFGEAAAYAEVWEWGNARQTKEGPKTVLGINPDGDNVWLSIQAPVGYISVNENLYWDILKQELGKVKFSSSNAKGITEELEKASLKAMKRIRDLIADTAPYDKGDLSESFQVVKPNDVLLDKDDSERLLLIGMED